MIGLMFLVGIAIWIVVSVYLSKWVLGLFNPNRLRIPGSIALFVVILFLPVADEIVGRWQFSRLCEREAVVWLSPGWEGVKEARPNSPPIRELDGYAIPIRVQQVEYIEALTNEPFLRYKSFHTGGGFLFGRLGLSLGTSISCRPPNVSEVMKKINIDQLLKLKGAQ